MAQRKKKQKPTTRQQDLEDRQLQSLNDQSFNEEKFPIRRPRYIKNKQKRGYSHNTYDKIYRFIKNRLDINQKTLRAQHSKSGAKFYLQNIITNQQYQQELSQIFLKSQLKIKFQNKTMKCQDQKRDCLKLIAQLQQKFNQHQNRKEQAIMDQQGYHQDFFLQQNQGQQIQFKKLFKIRRFLS